MPPPPPPPGSEEGPPPPLPPLPPDEVTRIIGGAVEAEYWRLANTPGYCPAPLSWDAAAALVRDGSEAALGRLGRDPAGVAVYWGFKRELDAAYRSTEDYVKITILGYGSVVGGDGRRQAGAPPPPPPDGSPRIIFRPNDFPYNFEAGIEHHNVWASRPLTGEELAAAVASHRPPSAGWEAVAFVNPAALASIPSIWHAHVLSRRKGAKES